MRKTLASLLALALGLVAGPSATAGNQQPLRVVASFSILADLVTNVGGTAVSVTTLVGRDADAHAFTPSPGDMRAINDADAVFVNGLGFEPWLRRVAGTIDHPERIFVLAGRGDGDRMRRRGHKRGHGHGFDHMGDDDDHGHGHGHKRGHMEDDDHEHRRGERDHMEDDEHGHGLGRMIGRMLDHMGDDDHGHEHGHERGHMEDDDHEHGHGRGRDHMEDDEHGHRRRHSHTGRDPHVWQSVPSAMRLVLGISDGLCQVDRHNCAFYRERTVRYLSELGTLDRHIREQVARIPEDKRRAVVPHDAFGHFGTEYGIEFVALSGTSTHSEPSAKRFAEIAEQVRQLDAHALFVENVSDERAIEQIGRETGVGVGGKLYSDALSAKGGPAPTYVEMMRHNAHTMVEAFGAATGSLN